MFHRSRKASENAPLLISAVPGPGVAGRVLGGLFGFAWNSVRLLFTIGVYFACLAAASYWAIGYFIRGKEVLTPDLTAKTVSESLQFLKRDDLTLAFDREEPSDTLNSGEIITQFPRPGTRIKSGSPIRVTISSGRPMKDLPADLIGQGKLQAGIRLRELGFDVGTVATAPVAGQGNDRVLAMDPPAGAAVAPGSKINLLVSLDRDAQKFLMPDLFGLTPDEARRELDRYGLKLAFTRAQIDSAKPGTVIRQDPTAGASVTAGAEVEIVVSEEF